MGHVPQLSWDTGFVHTMRYLTILECTHIIYNNQTRVITFHPYMLGDLVLFSHFAMNHRLNLRQLYCAKEEQNATPSLHDLVSPSSSLCLLLPLSLWSSLPMSAVSLILLSTKLTSFHKWTRAQWVYLSVSYFMMIRISPPWILQHFILFLL